MLKKTIIFTVIFLVCLQFISVEKTNPQVDAKITLNTSPKVMELLKKSCYDCHSYETKWPYYSNIAPISFFVASHVQNGRKALNFSKYKEIDPEIKKLRLRRAITTINNGMMALPSYISTHDEAILTKDEKKILADWFEKEISLQN